MEDRPDPELELVRRARAALAYVGHPKSPAIKRELDIKPGWLRLDYRDTTRQGSPSKLRDKMPRLAELCNVPLWWLLEDEWGDAPQATPGADQAELERRLEAIELALIPVVVMLDPYLRGKEIPVVPADAQVLSRGFGRAI
jgi:hypothetical protein